MGLEGHYFLFFSFFFFFGGGTLIRFPIYLPLTHPGFSLNIIIVIIITIIILLTPPKKGNENDHGKGSSYSSPNQSIG